MTAHDHYNEGIRLLKAGKAKEALEEFHKALEIAPDTPDFLSERGVAYFHLEKFELAMMDLNRAQQLEPMNGYRYSSRAYVRDRMGDVYGAIEDYRKAVEIDPEDAVSYNNLGLVEEKLGYQEKAKRNFDRADQLAREKDIFAPSEKSGESISVTEKKSNPGNSGNPSPTERKSYWSVIRSVFTTGEGLKDFLRFLRKGLKS